MKTVLNPNHSGRAERGYALLLVMVFAAISFTMIGAVMQWSSTNSNLIQRNNEYYNAIAAAEASTEQALTSIEADFQSQGEAVVRNNMNKYRAKVPNKGQHLGWSKYKFNNGKGNKDETSVERLTSWTYTNLQSQYAGLKGMASTYRIISNAENMESPARGVVGAVSQEVQIASVPIFQFAIFYSIDLEINPGANMTVNGPVHGNANIYSQPGATLTFNKDVTAVQQIILDKKPGDPSSRTGGRVVFQGEHDGNVASKNLPLGTNNSPDAVRAILEVPPNNESPNSNIGKERLYNKADLIIEVDDRGVDVHGGVANGNGPAIQWTQAKQFVNTNGSFYNKREAKTVKAIEIDISKLRTWNAGGNPLRNALGRDVSSVYVVDNRTVPSGTESGVRLINGERLLPLGLTVATPNPLYVKGDFNVTKDGTTYSRNMGDTANTLPAALMADAITVLSSNWNDANGGGPLDNRTASNTTLNAALLSGIVPTTNGSYSGGVENFPRFLENWSGKSLNYNGSMVVMFDSRIATGKWKGTGNTYDIYNPPTRNWAFDLNFQDPTKLPPLTPAIRTLIRSKWAIIRPNTSGT